MTVSDEQVSLQNRKKMRGFVADSKEKDLFEGRDGFNQVKKAHKDIQAWIVAELRGDPAPPTPDASETPD